jgi:hypothetical protein
MAGFYPSCVVLKCSRLKDKFYLGHSLSYKFQIKCRMLRINPFTHEQCFQTFGPYTSSLDSLCSLIIILFSHISFSFLDNILACAGRCGTNVSGVLYNSKSLVVIIRFGYIVVQLCSALWWSHQNNMKPKHHLLMWSL